jgi:hypothetical protein
VAGIVRPAAFTGGDDGVHSSAYVLVAALLGTFTLRRTGYLSNTGTFLLAVPLLAFLVAFQVRTTWMMVLVYFTNFVIQQVSARDRPSERLPPPRCLRS